MRSPARLNIAVSLLAITVAAACSDSTGPKEPTAAQVAAHFDSIAIDAQTQSQTHESYSGRNLLATLIELPAALGAVPASVSVTTANGVERWKAYELLLLPLETARAATRPFSCSNVQRCGCTHGSPRDLRWIGSGQRWWHHYGRHDRRGSFRASATTWLTSVGSACSTPATLLVNPQLASLAIGTCTLAKFTTTTEFHFALDHRYGRSAHEPRVVGFLRERRARGRSGRGCVGAARARDPAGSEGQSTQLGAVEAERRRMT